MLSFPSTECNKITMSMSPPCVSVPYNSGTTLFLPNSVPRNVHVKQRLYCVRVVSHAFDGHKNSENGGTIGEYNNNNNNQALDAVLKLYSALSSNNTQQLSDILSDECRCVCNFLSFFQAFQGKKQVLEFFSYLIKILGKNLQIVVKPTLQDGMYVGVEWKFESDMIHVPLGKGFSLHICQSYRGKALISNIEMFMEPLLYLEPFRLKMIGVITMLTEKLGSLMMWKSEKKARKGLSILLSLLSMTAFLFFLRLASSKTVS